MQSWSDLTLEKDRVEIIYGAAVGSSACPLLLDQAFHEALLLSWPGLAAKEARTPKSVFF